VKHPRGSYGAIVVGGGHNGLVCGAYLARAGIRTVVLESRPVAGGMAATAEIAPGVRAPVVAHTVGRLRPSVARDLALREHGLSLVQPQVRAFAPQPDGRVITLWNDARRTAADLERGGLVSASDALDYPAVDRRLRALGKAMGTLMARTPPDLTQPSLAEAFDGLRTGLRARARGGDAGESLLRALPMSAHDLLGEWFESDALRAAIAARAVLYTAMSPRMPGTAQVLIADAAGNEGGLAGQTVFARGGPGALAAALAAAARANGAEVRTDAKVTHVRHAGDRVVGVTLADGEEIDASLVVSSLDPKRTLLSLLDPMAIGPRLSWRAGNIRARGVTAKVNLALRDLPRFTALAEDDGDSRRLRGRIVIAPSMGYLERAADAGKYGAIAAEPYIEATIPTLVDPSLIDEARAGAVRHVLSAIVQAAPYELREGSWDERSDELADIVVGTLEQYAPGLGALVEARHVVTPLDLEREYGVTGGHPLHAEAGLDQWFAWRPLHGMGRHRLPLEGMYLCGSGAHPGGGVTGGPGQLAARAIVDDIEHGLIGALGAEPFGASGARPPAPTAP
jgi:phytoene dehydrogenase-like protein